MIYIYIYIYIGEYSNKIVPSLDKGEFKDGFLVNKGNKYNIADRCVY